MAATPRLSLPYVAAAQSQKHVTVNESLALLDALVHLRLAALDAAMPPGSPAGGDCYGVPAGASGAWAGHDGKVAIFRDGAWDFATPMEGWRAYVAAVGRHFVHRGGAWTAEDALISDLANLSRLGVGTSADAANPLSVKAGAALLAARTVAEGGSGDFRLTINKETAAKTASLVFQDAYSGRAEMGLAGDDDFRVKVSANGVGWTDALTISRSSGAVGLGSASLAGYGLRIVKPMTGTASPIGVSYTGTVQPDATGFPNAVMTSISTAEGSYTVTGMRHFCASQGSFGAGSSIISQIGFMAASSLTGGQNNFGFLSDVPAGAGRWNFFANGSATNHFSGSVCIGTTNAPAKLTVAGAIAPSADNAHALGTASLRFSTVYAATGTINTSDEREKCDIADSELGLDFVRLLKPRSYRWRVGALQPVPPDAGRKDDGDFDAAEAAPVARPGRRRHYGLIAQEVRDALQRLGTHDFGGYVLADANDPESRQGLRYDQFIAPLVKALQEVDRRVCALERTGRG